MILIHDRTGVAYCMDRTEVTSGQYKEFLTSIRFAPPPRQAPWCSWNTVFDAGFLDQNSTGAATSVDWCDAYAYCAWAGKRLCGRIGGGPTPFGAYADSTLSQWYNACSASGQRIYPYGNTYDRRSCNGDNLVGVSPVAAKPDCKPSADGPMDLSGNAWEWEDSCSGQTGAHDYCRLRGGSRDSNAKNLECGNEYDLGRDETAGSVGFRCCAEIASD